MQQNQLSQVDWWSLMFYYKNLCYLVLKKWTESDDKMAMVPKGTGISLQPCSYCLWELDFVNFHYFLFLLLVSNFVPLFVSSPGFTSKWHTYERNNAVSKVKAVNSAVSLLNLNLKSQIWSLSLYCHSCGILVKAPLPLLINQTRR